MKAEEIAKEIFYLPATNDKAKESIEHGTKLIQDYAEQQVKEFIKHVFPDIMYDSEIDVLYKIWKEQQDV